MKNKKGFISMSLIFSFFVVFIVILLALLGVYANNRLLSNKVKSKIKTEISELADVRLYYYVRENPYDLNNASLKATIPSQSEYVFQTMSCFISQTSTPYTAVAWSDAEWRVTYTKPEKSVECDVYFTKKSSTNDKPFDYKTGTPPQVYTAPVDGYYRIDLNGAGVNGYRGAKTTGVIYLTNQQSIYFYIGGANGDNGGGLMNPSSEGSKNDGKYHNGAGASDVRTISGGWSSNFGNRIMVAGGSGALASGNGANADSWGYQYGQGQPYYWKNKYLGCMNNSYNEETFRPTPLGYVGSNNYQVVPICSWCNPIGCTPDGPVGGCGDSGDGDGGGGGGGGGSQPSCNDKYDLRIETEGGGGGYRGGLNGQGGSSYISAAYIKTAKISSPIIPGGASCATVSGTSNCNGSGKIVYLGYDNLGY